MSGTLNQCKVKYFDIIPLSYLNKLMLPSDFNGTHYTWVCIFKTIPDSNDPSFNQPIFLSLNEVDWSQLSDREVVCYSLTVQNIKQHNILFTAGSPQDKPCSSEVGSTM